MSPLSLSPFSASTLSVPILFKRMCQRCPPHTGRPGGAWPKLFWRLEQVHSQGFFSLYKMEVDGWMEMPIPRCTSSKVMPHVKDESGHAMVRAALGGSRGVAGSILCDGATAPSNIGISSAEGSWLLWQHWHSSLCSALCCLKWHSAISQPDPIHMAASLFLQRKKHTQKPAKLQRKVVHVFPARNMGNIGTIFCFFRHLFWKSLSRVGGQCLRLCMALKTYEVSQKRRFPVLPK